MNTRQTKIFLIILTLALPSGGWLNILRPSGLFCQRLVNDSWKYQLVKLENANKPVKFWHFNSDFTQPGAAKIAVQNEQIDWLDGSQPGTLPLPAGYVRSVISRAGKYLGILSIPTLGDVKEKTENKMVQLQLFSSTGEKLYEIKSSKHFDDPLTSVAISDKDGSVVLGQNALGKLWFYDRNGKRYKETDLFTDATYDLERLLQMDFTKDGEVLALLASKRGASPMGSGAPNPSGEPHLFLFTLTGEELWRHPLPEFNAGQIAIAPDGRYIVASHYTADLEGNIKKRTSIFDEHGQEIQNMDLLFRVADFSPDSKYLILAERTLAKAIELPTGNVLWTHNISRKQGMITEAALSENGELGLLLLAKNEFRQGAFIFTNPRVLVLNRLGKIVQEIDLEEESFYTPALKFAEDHKYIILGLRDSYRIYGSVTE